MAVVITSTESRDDASPARPSPHASVVLVVDDHEDTRFMHRYVLESLGYSVLEAGDGEEAVAVAERERPDLILMDAVLPRLDGLSATRRIRENPSLPRVPVLFLSGRAEPSFRASALEAGCDDYLVKPVTLKALGQAIEKYLRRATLRPTGVGMDL
jgi:CheY-like chemotaxis protein